MRSARRQVVLELIALSREVARQRSTGGTQKYSSPEAMGFENAWLIPAGFLVMLIPIDFMLLPSLSAAGVGRERSWSGRDHKVRVERGQICLSFRVTSQWDVR